MISSGTASHFDHCYNQASQRLKDSCCDLKVSNSSEYFIYMKISSSLFQRNCPLLCLQAHCAKHLTYGCIYPSLCVCVSVRQGSAIPSSACDVWYTSIAVLRKVLSPSLLSERTHLISAVTCQIKGDVCEEIVSLQETSPLQIHAPSSIIGRRLLCALLSCSCFTFTSTHRNQDGIKCSVLNRI